MTFIEFVGAELARRWEVENATAVAVREEASSRE
jgi:hypothetical protein